jgi:PAS domain S-box-containing protein
MRTRASRTLRYGVAVLVVELSVAILVLLPTLSQGLASLLYLAVLIAAWFGGKGPGLLATALIDAVALLLPEGPYTAVQILGVVVFTAGGLVITALVESLHAARRRAEASQARLSAVLTSIGDAVIATDGRGHVTFMNPVAAALTGSDPAAAEGQPLADVFRIVGEASRQPAEDPVARVLREGMVVGLGNHTILIAGDGSERPIDDSAAPIREGEGPIEGVVLVFRDVTERRRQQREVARLLAAEQEARREAEAANRAKDHFLAVLSHELRTPLTPVLMSASSLIDDPEVPTKAREALELTRHNVQLEARLIDDLLDISRIARGRLALEREVVDAHALIRRAAETCGEEVRAAGLRLDLDLEAEAHHVEADPARLQQVFWNLIKNAVKFTPAGGTVSIRTRNEGQDEDETRGRRLVVEVIDTGIGIAPGALPRIFDAFEQGDASAWSRRSGGLGLGLAISRSVAEAHGGRLHAHSPGPGEGSTFTLEMATVPAPGPAPRGPAPAPEHAVAPGRLTILLVEDDGATRSILARLLRRRGHVVIEAGSLAEGIERTSSYIDLVISDLGLPDGNGLDLMRQVRARGPIPGIALSGFGMEDDLRKSREAGFAMHLTKPVDFPTLEGAIRRVVGGARGILEDSEAR